MSILLSSFKQSLKSAPYVLKVTHLYFGLYFIIFFIYVFFSLPHILSSEQDVFPFSSIHSIIISSISCFFLSFIIPYYTYKHFKGPDIKPFWSFIKKTFWPVIWNYHIKTNLIILFSLLLFIVPGIYKAVRLSFVPETIFFDNLYRKGQISALKGSDKTTRGYFWPVCLALILTFVLCDTIPSLTLFLLKKYSSFQLITNEIIAFILQFHIDFFVLLFYTHFYFELKQKRSESISC